MIIESAAQGTGIIALLYAARALTTVPIVVWWQDSRSEQRLSALAAGAADALDGSEFSERALPFVVLRAVENSGTTSLLSRHQREFRDFLDSASDAVCGFFEDRVAYRNASFDALMLQLGLNQMQQFSDLFGMAPQDEVKHRLLGEDAAHPFDLTLGADDDRQMICSVRLRKVEFEGRQVWLATLRDVSRERRNEEMWIDLQVAYQELKASQEQLFQAHKLQLLGELAAGVAHDFNNVLSAVLGRAQLLKRYITQPEWKRSIDIIEQAALDGAETVRRIQGFATQRMDQPPELIDLNEVLRDALEFTRTRWFGDQGRRARYSVESSFGEIPSVSGQPSELREVMVNLIGNAIDAMPNGGVLRIRTVIEDGMVVAEVRDSGMGMSAETRARALDPFFTTKGERGTGLGLSVSVAIITRHRGTLEIASTQGSGTSIVLRFPFGASAIVVPKAKLITAPLQIKGSGRAHVLVVDDDEHIRLLMQELLSLEGHDVTVADSADAALAAARGQTFDVAFVDLTVPGGSGFEVARALKDKHAAQSVGIVTGYGAVLDQAALKDSGVDFVVAKPFKTEAILSHINLPLTRLS